MTKKRENENSFYKLLTISLGIISTILLIIFISMIFQNNSVNVPTKIVNQTELKQTINQKNTKMGNIAKFETNYGNFEIELFLDESPITAGNFKKLIQEGFYDKTRFHRVIKDFMIQGGDPNSKDLSKVNLWGTGGSGRVIADEFISGLSNVRGTLSMANSGPNSGSSQFFINVVDNTFLDWDKQPAQSKHPVFAKVISGMDIVDKIVNVKTAQADRPAKEVLINKVSIIN